MSAPIVTASLGNPRSTSGRASAAPGLALWNQNTELTSTVPRRPGSAIGEACSDAAGELALGDAGDRDQGLVQSANHMVAGPPVLGPG